MKKVLFLINGLGMGNSTRCDSIIEHLWSKKIKVDIITSGNGLEYFNNKDYVENLYSFKSLNYGKNKNGKLSIASTFFKIPIYLKILLGNVLYLNQVISKIKYNAIIIDSDYTLLFLKWKINIPIFALNNAHIIVNECKQRKYIPQNIKAQLFIEKLDKIFHDLVPNYVLSPTLKKLNSTKQKINFLPFVRKSLINKKHKDVPKEVKNCLVMLSGSSFGSSTNFLKNLKINKNIIINVVGRNGLSTKNIYYHGKIMKNEELILNSDIMVINAGFSAVSEAFYLGIPAIVIPVENHAEQYINASIFENYGLGYVANIDNINEKINQLLINFQTIKINHIKNQLRKSESNAAALFIKEKI